MGVDRATLAWHLSRDLDPPVELSEAAIASCQRAIAAVAEGRPDEVIVDDRTATQVVAEMGLQSFIFPAGLSAVWRLDTRDYEPYGQLDRVPWRGDCSAGCRWFCPLQGKWRLDWGVCANPRSHRAGLVTFEHQGCPEFEPGEDTDSVDFGPGASEG